MQDLKPAALISESGKVVTTGLHRPEDTPAALQNLLKNLREAGITCPDKPEVAITNIICSCDLGYPLNRARIMIALMDHKRVVYEPEFLPGLVCRISDMEILFLFFLERSSFPGKEYGRIRPGQTSIKEKLSIVA